MSSSIDPRKDLYSELGLKSDATQDDIKSAFRKLAQQHHPDRGGDQQKFKEINAAHQVLSDESKRKEYDDLRELMNPRRGSRIPFPGFRPVNVGIHMDHDFMDAFIYRSVHATRQEATPSPDETVDGEDIEIDIQLSLEESIKGCSKVIILKSGRLVVCPHCNGSGGEPGSSTVICPDCQGVKTRVSFKNHNHGRRTIDCPTCRKQGHVHLTKCKKCGGRARINGEREVTINIPAGVSEGDRLRSPGQGTPGVNTAPGDLFMNIKIKDHEHYTKVGLDLHTIFRIPIIQALKGGIVQFTYLDGTPMDIRIPPKVIPGTTVARIKGKGMTHPMRKKVGDLCLHFEIELPKTLSEKAVRLIDELEEEIEKANGTEEELGGRNTGESV